METIQNGNEPEQNSRSILIVDDNKDFCELFKVFIESENHQVKIALNGEEGMRLCEQHSFDLVLTDIFMPEKDGLEMVGELKQKFPQIKVIAMCGKSNLCDNYLKAALGFGAHACLQKPFELSELLEMIERVFN